MSASWSLFRLAWRPSRGPDDQRARWKATVGFDNTYRDAVLRASVQDLCLIAWSLVVGMCLVAGC